jgi:integrase
MLHKVAPLLELGAHGGVDRHARGRLEAAGLPKLKPYAMRHTFASFAIAAGVSLFYLARILGTSVEQIDRTYGHLLPDSENYLRGLLDAFDVSATTDEADAAQGE